MAGKQKNAAEDALLRVPDFIRRIGNRATSGSVRQLCATIRRAESLLKSNSTAGTQKLRKQLRRIRKRAGKVRDIDVQIEILKTVGMCSDSNATEVDRSLRKERDQKKHKLRKVIESDKKELISRIDALAATRQLTAQSDYKIDLWQIANKFIQCFNGTASAPENLHRFRLSCKKLQYKSELAASSILRDKLVKELKSVQDSIGTWRDYNRLTTSAERALKADDSPSLHQLRVQTHSRYLEGIRSVRRAKASIKKLLAPPIPCIPAQSNVVPFRVVVQRTPDGYSSTTPSRGLSGLAGIVPPPAGFLSGPGPL